MDTITKKILGCLGDGRYHSVLALEKRLNLASPAVKKAMDQLQRLDITVENNSALGYRIPEGIELLSKKIIHSYLSEKFTVTAEDIIILDSVSSTNSYIAKKMLSTKNVNICLAEMQTAGRGRHEKKWFSPYAKNIYLSIGYYTSTKLNQLSGLSLAMAIAITNALEQYGIKEEITIKWPNDILWKGHKLAGILIETIAKSPNLYQVIIGVGLNVAMPLQNNIDQPWCDISRIIKDTPDRNKVAGLVLNNLLVTLNEFQRHGFKHFAQKWQQLDLVLGKMIAIVTPHCKKISGLGWGIDSAGNYLVKTENGKIEKFTAGELSLEI